MSNLSWLFVLVGAVALILWTLQIVARRRLQRLEGKEIPQRWHRQWPDPMLLFISAPGCRVCESERPKLQNFREEVSVREITVTENPALIQYLQVFATPTWVWVESGRVRHAWVGRLPNRIFRQWVNSKEAPHEA